MKRKILFRADGNSSIGLGHVYRSLALASILNLEFECHFAIVEPEEVLKTMIQRVCPVCIELPPLNSCKKEAQFIVNTYLANYDIVITDHYKVNTEYQSIIKTGNCKLVCIDDIYAYHFVADAVINHAPGLRQSNYSIEDYTKLYLGLDYSLLREEFYQAAMAKRHIESIDNLFICLGGADTHNLTLKILQKP